MSQHSTLEIDRFGTPPGYEAARSGAGLIDRRERGRIVVSGADRKSYLQGLLTNDVAALEPGQGCYAAYLTAQGRMISDLWVFELGDVILLSLPAATKDTVLMRLDQFIFSEDVQLGDVTTTFSGVTIVGPRAAEIVAAVLSPVTSAFLEELGDGGNRRVTFSGEPSMLLRTSDSGVPGYEVLVDRQQFDRLWEALAAAGAEPISPESAEALRVEGGVPQFHRDMDEETIPLEAGIEGRAISFSKGCYVGQEVIIRVTHRGHGRVARKLVGLLVDGDGVAQTGSAITLEGRNIGAITSAVWSPALSRSIAMGYVRREQAGQGSVVQIGDTAATVTALPFVP
jgi:folate-binding protein YgfZ